jgi:hypothetical protein
MNAESGSLATRALHREHFEDCRASDPDTSTAATYNSSDQPNSSAIVPIGRKRRRGAFGSAMKPYFE